MKNNSYRISDEATSNDISASSVETAVKKFLSGYDTAEMESGETFAAKVYDAENILLAIATVVADGKSGVKSWTIRFR